ncbi:MAG: Lpp/OprI family alanine-zipper lipoprotein [Gammaproteobacteria bacterium]|nr:Lpp/OprI family alanine-zipper lipoprotein [Gammaproteobacteria bacterium]
MKNTLQIASIVFVAAMATGCANTSQLQADIDALKAQMNTVSAEAAEANERSKAAEASANRAEQTAADANSKLDRMFKKSMMK